ncbi:MAG: hypothetical protein ABII12_16510 [Planctomycetota bacterium]
MRMRPSDASSTLPSQVAQCRKHRNADAMNAADYIRQRQILWAKRSNIKLVPAPHKEGQNPASTRTECRDRNLFQPLSNEAVAEYERADGAELKAEGGAPKFHSLWSSSALAVNFFHYWRSQKDKTPICKACGISAAKVESMQCEAQLPIAENVNRKKFPRDPNLDVLISYDSGKSPRMTGIECKFSEAYAGRGHGGMREAYLEDASLWTDLQNCRKLARSISPNDTGFSHLHPAQLLKHILGLKHKCGSKTKFCLLYLWYDVPFDAGAAHRREIEKFRKTVVSDGINFKAVTYQEVILSLARNYGSAHAGYVDYLAERYL